MQTLLALALEYMPIIIFSCLQNKLNGAHIHKLPTPTRHLYWIQQQYVGSLSISSNLLQEILAKDGNKKGIGES